MSSMIGMNVEEVGRIARDLATQVRGLEDLRTQVGRLVDQSSSVWKGADAGQLSSAWRSEHRPKLDSLITALAELVKQAEANAQAQEAVSSDLGLASCPADGPGSSTPGNPLKGDPVDPFGTARDALPKDQQRFVGPEYYTGSDDLADKPLGSDSDISLSKIQELSEGNLELVSGSTEWSDSVWSKEASGEADLGAGVTASGSASVAVLAASAGASGSIGFKDGVPTASGSAQAEANLFKAEAQGQIGNDFAALSGAASAVVGAKAAATGSIGADGVKAGASASAFAGAQASATAQVNVGGVKPSVTGQVYAGIGAHASADVEITATRVHASVSVGAALGLGAGLSFDIDIDVAEVGKNLSKLFHW